MNATHRTRPRRLSIKVLVALLVILVAIQFVPYGRNHTNPPVLAEPDWSDEATRTTFMAACGDCHSNETRWPWYSHVAPVSWLVAYDVKEGRSHVNVSEWGLREYHADEAADMVREGEMPLWYYLPTHPEARLSDDQERELVRGLVATFGDEAAGQVYGEGESAESE